jgi:hypothetical protein
MKANLRAGWAYWSRKFFLVAARRDSRPAGRAAPRPDRGAGLERPARPKSGPAVHLRPSLRWASGRVET